MSARRGIRWAVGHGIARVVVRRHARRGDLSARLIADPSLREDPFPQYDNLREQGPLVPGALGLTTTRHDVCTEVLRSDDFSVAQPRTPSPLIRFALAISREQKVLGPTEPPSMLAVDPPDHTRYRKLVTRAFSVKAIEALRVRTQEIATGLLDEMADEDTVDMVERYASLLPVTVIAEMLGVPVDMRERFLRWGTGAALSLDAGLGYRNFRRAESDLLNLHQWMLGHFDQLRRRSGDNILSKLVGIHDEDGSRLSEDELSSIAMLLLAAGFETTVNLLGSGIALLVRHPEQRDPLLADPTQWPNAVEELLRYESPVQRTGRIAKRDTEAGGVAIPEGTFVLTLLGGANRDPHVFDEPHRFDVARSNAREHLGFSSGHHYCLGAGLARMEGEIGLRTLFERFPDIALVGPPHRRPTRVLRGYDAMPAALSGRVHPPTSVSR